MLNIFNLKTRSVLESECVKKINVTLIVDTQINGLVYYL